MLDYLVKLCNAFDNVLREKTGRNSYKHMTSECAYALSAINKKGTIADVINDFEITVLTIIEREAKRGETYLMIEYPFYLSNAAKTEVTDFLKTKGFRVPFCNEDILLVSWKLNYAKGAPV